MASVTYRCHRKLANGSYEVVHSETESGVVVRPNEETVEQTLKKTLRMKNAEDVVPGFHATIDADTLQGKTIDEILEPLKTSVSEGKKLIAAAVTDKGVETAADATFKTMADNIENISTGGYGGTLQCTAATDIAAGDLLILDSMSENFKSTNGYRDDAYRLDSGYLVMNTSSAHRNLDCFFVDKAGVLHKWTYKETQNGNPSNKCVRYANDVFTYMDLSLSSSSYTRYAKIDRESGTIVDATTAEATGSPSPKTKTDNHTINTMYRSSSASSISVDAADGSWCGTIDAATVTSSGDSVSETGSNSMPMLIETDIGDVILVNYLVGEYNSSNNQYIVMLVPDSNGSYAPNIAYKASEYTGIDWDTKLFQSSIKLIPFIGKAVTSAASGETLTVVNMGPYHPGAFNNA